MSNTVAISQVGGAIAGGGNTTGLPPGSGQAPGNVTDITVTGTLDPIALEISLVVTFTAPVDSGDTWSGVHAYLDIPDHGDGASTAVVGSATVGTSQVLGPFNPIDLGLQTDPTQPWYFSCPFPGNLGLNPNVNIPCRLYLASTSVVSANQLVQDGQSNATPNAAFTLVSLASGSPTAGTNIASNCGTIICQPLSPDTSTGKSMTPFLATMGSVPAKPPKGWGYRLYLYTGTGVPTDVSSLLPLTDVCTAAGIVPAGKSDLVTDVQNSFAIQTPGAPTTATVYAVAGLVGAGGAFTANNIVPGITNSCLIQLGTSSGTIDAAQAELTSLSAEMQVSSGLFGIAPSGVTNEFLGSAAVETINIKSLAVQNAQLASLAVEATNLASGSVATSNVQSQAITSSQIANLAVGTSAIQDAAITNALIANLAVGNTQIQDGAIENAQIGSLAVAYGNIASCAVSALLAGTATFSSTVTFANSSGPSVEITSTEVLVTGGTYTIGVNSSSGISISSSSSSLDITSSGITMNSGSNYLTVSSSELLLSYGGNSTSSYPNIAILDDSVYVSATADDYLEILSSSLLLYSGGNLALELSPSLVQFTIATQTTTISSVGLTTPSLTLSSPTTLTSATAGSASALPSAPAIYVVITIEGTRYALPGYTVPV